MRLMLVDDETRVLEGLARVLHDRIDDIDIHCFTSASAALDALSSGGGFDVLVTDMQMPVMDGAQLLACVHHRWPDIARVVLSGHMDEQMALKAMTHAHQFLLKPCNGDLLEKAVARAARLRGVMSDGAVRAAVGDRLPAVPPIYTQLAAKLHNPRAAVADIVEVLGKDAELSAKTIALAASLSAEPVTTLAQAVSKLGLRPLQAVLLLAAMKPTEELEERAMTAARVLTSIARGNQDAFMAAVLADIGKIVMHEMHPEVGAYLLGHWGLPLAVVDAVRFHHEPRRALPEHARSAALAHVALAAAERFEPDVDAVRSILGADADKVLTSASSALV